VNTETVKEDARTDRDRVWRGPGLPRSIDPLLAGLGIELLAPSDRERATILVESIQPLGADGRPGFSTGRLRVARASGDALEAITNSTIEFEGPGAVWAAASCIVSQAFGLSPPLLTADAAMFAVIRAATRAGQVDSPILVTGETGTGKELLVRLIHAASGRSGGMSSVNCAALNDGAFKHLPGDAAARDAAVAQNRLAELCLAADTTLLLDQVSELSPASQTRLLHAILQADDFATGASMVSDFRAGEAGDSRNGGSINGDSEAGATMNGDFEVGKVRRGARLVSATNQPLGKMVLNGRFKRELYDQLAVLTLAVPPLRERRADIGLLAPGFLRLAASRLSFTPGALRAFGNYPFPGNVRELHNLVTRLAIMQRDGASQLIHTSDVRPQLLGSSITPSIWKSSPFRMRREMAMQALMVCGGDNEAAARKLGISVRALQQHIVATAGSAGAASRSR
jgi:transcriptional regulator of acetoin/glycerol metabolism